jgi:hypothetical protein
LEVAPEQTPYPVAHYVAWLSAQLPAAWADIDPAFSGPGDPVEWAMARLHDAQEIVTPILRDLCRLLHRTPRPGAGESRVLVAAPKGPLVRGVYRATVDLPLNFAAPTVATVAGEPLPSIAAAIMGERDPLHGYRRRVQMQELVTWLARGEIHEYQLRLCELLCEGGELRLVADLWPAALGDAPEANLAASAKVAAAIADPAVERFFVHLRMPRRSALLFELAEEVSEEYLILKVILGQDEAQEEMEAKKRTIRFFQDGTLASDPSELSLVVQLT